MSVYPSTETLAALEARLKAPRPLPADPVAERIVSWHVFRRQEEAREFGRHILLGKGEELIGGLTRDSLGPLYWVGVRVEDSKPGAIAARSTRPTSWIPRTRKARCYEPEERHYPQI